MPLLPLDPRRIQFTPNKTNQKLYEIIIVVGLHPVNAIRNP